VADPVDHPAEAVTKSQGVTAFKEYSADWKYRMGTKTRVGFVQSHVIAVAGNLKSHCCNGK
jgi:hypothetical protein